MQPIKDEIERKKSMDESPNSFFEYAMHLQHFHSNARWALVEIGTKIYLMF